MFSLPYLFWKNRFFTYQRKCIPLIVNENIHCIFELVNDILKNRMMIIQIVYYLPWWFLNYRTNSNCFCSCAWPRRYGMYFLTNITTRHTNYISVIDTCNTYYLTLLYLKHACEIQIFLHIFKYLCKQIKLECFLAFKSLTIANLSLKGMSRLLELFCWKLL